MKADKIALGADRAGSSLKEIIRLYFEERGIAYSDYTPQSFDNVDYPDIALHVAQMVARGLHDRAILICGTGIGMAIAANKVPNVYAALAHDTYSAVYARKSNNAQVLTMGARVVGAELAKSIVQAWLDSEFADGPSTIKIAKIKHFETCLWEGNHQHFENNDAIHE